MEGLRRTLTGRYNAKEVDRLIVKIKSDYEECLSQQKQRILDLREENRKLSEAVEEYRRNARVIVGTLTQAEQTARLIVEQAERDAMKRLAEAEQECIKMQAETQTCCRRLMDLKKASESVYLAASKAVMYESAHSESAVRVAAHAALELYDAGKRQ